MFLTMIRAASLAAMAAVFVPPAPAAAQTTSDIARKARATWDAISAYSADKKNDAVAHGSDLLQDTDARIRELQAKAAAASGSAKTGYERQVDELKVQRARMAAQMDEAQKSGGAAWETTKVGFSNAYRDLHEAYDKASAELK